VVQAAARALLQESGLEVGPWGNLIGFRQNAPACAMIDVAVGSTPYFVAVDPAQPPEPVSIARIDGQRVLFRRGEAWNFGLPDSVRVAGAVQVSDGSLQSPMPGRIVSVAVRLGQIVTKGQTLLTLEAMKMEHALIAPFDGTVDELSASVGDQVAENVTLVRIAGQA
jgi:3-methylcrotonyl-CoA carboxylase alpha subunit